jgi:hypothetical protein
MKKSLTIITGEESSSDDNEKSGGDSTQVMMGTPSGLKRSSSIVEDVTQTDLAADTWQARLNDWLWVDENPPRKLKPTMHLVPSYSGNMRDNKCLFYYRCVAAFLMNGQAIMNTVSNCMHDGYPDIQFLTIDGIYCTALTMTLLALSHVTYKPQDALYTRKMCVMWKATCYLF